MTLKAHETFLTFTDCLSFSETARRMDCTQPAAFAHILQLQEQLGRPLYWRDGSGLKLSKTGIRLAALLRCYKEQVHIIGSKLWPEEISAPVTLAASSDITLFLLGPLLADLVQLIAPHQLQLRAFDAGYAAFHVGAGRSQLALAELDVQPDKTRSTWLGSWDYVVCSPPQFPAWHQQQLQLIDLAELPLILPPQDTRLRQALELAARTQGVTLKVKIEVPVYELMLRSVDQGLGHAIVPAYCLAGSSRQAPSLTDLEAAQLYLLEPHWNLDWSLLDAFKRALVARIQSL